MFDLDLHVEEIAPKIVDRKETERGYCVTDTVTCAASCYSTTCYTTCCC